MKRKFLCVLFMLAGVAVIAGTILFTLGRYEHFDTSPAWTLIYLSVVTVAAAARNVNKKPKEVSGYKKVFLLIFYVVSVLAILAGLSFTMFSMSFIYALLPIIIVATTIVILSLANSDLDEPEATERDMVFLRAFRAVSIFAILVCLTFIVIIGLSRYYTDLYGPLIALTAAGIAAAALNLRLHAPVSGRGKARAARCIPIVIAVAITATLCILFDALIFTIIVAITVAAAWFLYNNDEPYEPEATRLEKVFLRIFHAVSILVILVCLAFIVIIFFLTRYDDWIGLLRNVPPLMALAIAGIATAALNLKLRAPVSMRGKSRASRCIPMVAALVIAAALSFVYLNYMPKYSLDDGINILRSDEEFSKMDVFYLTFDSGQTTGGVTRETAEPGTIEGKTYYDLSTAGSFGGNPFYDGLFQYYCDSYGFDAGGLHIMKGYILFNPATGAYEYTREQEQDTTYSPGELPGFHYKFPWINYNFMYNFMYDEDGQHDAVLSLFLREQWPYVTVNGTCEVFSAGSGEWDAKMKDVMYPHNFPEDEALTLLRSMGEETLKTKILEQIDWSLSSYKDKTIEVYFFGIDIAAYQNGEIVLKL